MILMFVGYLQGYGGAEKMIIKLANAMADRGHSVILVGIAKNRARYKISNNVEYIFLHETTGFKVWKILNRYRKLKKCIDDKKPDLTVHFWMQSAYLCAFMGRKYAQKAIYAERGDPYDKEFNGIIGKLRTYTFKRIQGFVFQTKGARDFFNESLRSKSVIINNPVSITASDSLDAKMKEKRIVNIGRYHEQKNQILLIEAISLLPHDLDEYTVHIYGEGALKTYLQKRIDDLNLKDSIKLMGTSNDVISEIKDASLFVLTSDYEGMPNALIEAMALGLPCISTDYSPQGGVRELISNGKNGIVVPCNDPEKLSKAITYILRNKEKAARMGKEATKISGKLNPKLIWEQWELFFERMVIESKT